MLFYRVKPESNGKPYMTRRRGGVEYWSVIVGGELFTPNEVAKLGLDMNDLMAVDVNKLKTHYAVRTVCRMTIQAFWPSMIRRRTSR